MSESKGTRHSAFSNVGAASCRSPHVGEFLRNSRIPSFGKTRLRGFTLVELLVVIAIIGILVALLLPAVQAAREAARRTQCTNQLKQFATGCLNHESVTKHFPTGGWGWVWIGDADRGFGPDQPGGWIYNIMPFMEENARHDMAKDGNPNVDTEPQKLGAAKMLLDPMPILYCPSRRNGVFRNREYPIKPANNAAMITTGETALVARSDYAANMGHYQWGGERGPGALTQASTFKWGVISKSGMLDPNKDPKFAPDPTTNAPPIRLTGISFQRSAVGIRQVSDGTSKTYLCGEKYLDSRSYEDGRDTGDNETWCTGHNNDNFRSTAEPPQQDRDFENGDWFGSNHSSIWNAAFCDGHVESISYDIDPLVHLYNGNREDGTATPGN